MMGKRRNDGVIRLRVEDRRPGRDFDLGTREGMLEMIRAMGEYIVDHAENILGEYPGEALCGVDVTAKFRFGEFPTVTVTREHVMTIRGEDDGGNHEHAIR